MKKTKRNIKVRYISGFVLTLLIIIALNIISSKVYTRFDLTSEKRYTLSDVTKQLVESLDDIVYFKIYLEGEFPAGFKRLRRETKELLDEFRAYNKNIQYEFINPSESEDTDERNATYQLLIQQGLKPTNLQVKTKSGLEQQVIFPGAVVSYRNKVLPVELLDAQIGVPPEAVLNNSIQNLEFKFASVLHKLTRKVKPRIAFIEGHGELDKKETYDITFSLQDNYIVERVKMDGQVNALVNRSLIDSATMDFLIEPKYSAVIIAKPDSVFSSKDKFILDQYLMYGGKILWLIDPVLTSMDSIQMTESTVAVENNINLQDQLFSYGVKLNTDLIMDLNALPIPVRTGQVGGQPQIDFFPWYYFPLITSVSQHPVVRNLNAIKTQFVSSLDTSRVRNVDKTVLLQSSPYTRTVGVPAVISLAIMSEPPDERLYSGPPRSVCILLEGVFASHFRNRIPPSLADAREIGFKEYSDKTSMIVVSDGDVIRNQFHIPDGYPLPLGYDQFTKETFGNKEFILNALNYLTDGPGLISIRSRELKLRLLDKTKIDHGRLKWQLINVMLPILVVLLIGVLLVWLRKRKYAR